MSISDILLNTVHDDLLILLLRLFKWLLLQIKSSFYIIIFVALKLQKIKHGQNIWYSQNDKMIFCNSLSNNWHKINKFLVSHSHIFHRMSWVGTGRKSIFYILSKFAFFDKTYPKLLFHWNLLNFIFVPLKMYSFSVFLPMDDM